MASLRSDVTRAWPELASYDAWSATADTLHAHTQVLGKLAAALAPAEPELQHAALRLTPRGFETHPLPAPHGSGALVVALDLHEHQARVEHSDGRVSAVNLVPDRTVADVTRAMLDAVTTIAGPVRINPAPQEVAWTVPLDEDREHSRYDPDAVRAYFAAATEAALVLSDFRAPYRGRSTSVNAWWGSFDLAVSLFSGLPADPPAQDFIMRNAMDSQEVAVGWWPGDARHPEPAFYAYAHPSPADFAQADLAIPGAHWDEGLGEYVLDWNACRSSADPHRTAVAFARAVFAHACLVCGWDADLASSAQGTPPPLR